MAVAGGWGMVGRGGLRLRSILSFWGDLGLIILVSVFLVRCSAHCFAFYSRFAFCVCVLSFFFFFSGLSL